MPTAPRLLALSDLHVAFPENRKIVEELRTESDEDWLLLAGDVGELSPDIEWALSTLSARFARIVWTPGNHDLWTHPADQLKLRGESRYRHLVDQCRSLGVITPEDPYPVWTGPGGPATIVPLFLLYDYSFRPNGAHTKEEGLARAHETGVVCSDEALLHPDPYPQFAQWCGTTITRDWHVRYHAAVVVYGHLHIPRVTWHHGVRFEEVSLGYRSTRPSLPGSWSTARS